MLLFAARTDEWKRKGLLKKVPSQRMEDVSWEACNDLRDKLILAKYEGLILRPDVPYEFRPDVRSSMYKHKKMQEVDCVLLEVLPGEDGKKYADTAAKMLVELPNGNKCKCGLKLSDDARRKLWEHRNQAVGKVVEVHYQEETENEDGKPKLQFPVFYRFREDKS